MAKIITLFNHKGGVSKTTTAFHLGWMMAMLGKKVLLVDSDPQCNLTGLCAGDDIENLYSSDISSIRSLVSPVVEGKTEALEPANCYEFPNCPGLFLLPGHIDFSDYDAIYSIAENLTGSIMTFQNVPGALYNALLLTTQKYEFDYILIDMSPSITATNANILMQSDYFIVPSAPDYFCYMAIQSLARIFPQWSNSYQQIAKHPVFKDAKYKIKQQPPLFLGTIQQRFRPRNGSPARAFQRWINEINQVVSDRLVPALKSSDMLLQSDYKTNYEEPYSLMNIRDFNSLVALSQEHNTPVFLLTDEQIKRWGKALETAQKDKEDFFKIFEALATRVITLT